MGFIAVDRMWECVDRSRQEAWSINYPTTQLRNYQLHKLTEFVSLT
jgi:hypothetical protein